MTDTTSISPEAQAIYEGHRDLLDTAQALDSDIDQLQVRAQVVMKELNQIHAEIRKKLSERQACLAVASAMLECTPAMEHCTRGNPLVAIYQINLKG